jgi:periplasmic protein TonB
MSTTSMPLRAARGDALLWGLCFAAVVTAHVAAATLLLWKPSAEDDYGVDAPVVMLELPESFVVSTARPTNLAPGPLQEEIDPTPPPPKEETNSPEQPADIALPELPKPELPQQVQQQATAPPAAAPIVAVIRSWQSELRAHIERFKRYPPKAHARGDEGVARVSFTIDRDGRVRESHIVQSSGFAELDQEALAMLLRAQPMPRPPVEDFPLVIPVRFNIR